MIATVARGSVACRPNVNRCPATRYRGGMSDETTLTRPKRPFGVTLVVLLIWIAAILEVVGGIWLLFRSGDPAFLLQTEVDSGTAKAIAAVGIAFGVVMMLIASALGGGSNAIRILVSFLMVLRILAAPLAVVAMGSGQAPEAVVDLLFSLVILALLWNSKASAFFKPRRV